MLNSREKRGILAICAVLLALAAVIVSVRYCDRIGITGTPVNIPPPKVLVTDSVSAGRDAGTHRKRQRGSKKSRSSGRKKPRQDNNEPEGAYRELRNDPVPLKHHMDPDSVTD